MCICKIYKNVFFKILRHNLDDLASKPMYDLKPTNKIDYFEFKVIVWHIPRGFKISTISKIFKFLSKAKFPFSQIHKINQWCERMV